MLHKAESRGHASHGWLDTYHTFSFANYYDPERIRFGVLRVLNDDMVAPGMGFGTHPHDNMEIITIPIEGALEHKDSMGNSSVIRTNDIQVMSAGTGISHSEYNNSKEKHVSLLQIWIFPREKNVEPRYDQVTLNPEDRKNKLQQVLSPNPGEYGVWIHQDAWFHLGDFDSGKYTEYQIKRPENGAYLFVIEGDMVVNGRELTKRDGYGIREAEIIKITALSDSRFLLMDLPVK